MNDQKPQKNRCPICNSSAWVVDAVHFWVQCGKYECRFSGSMGTTIEEAIQKWDNVCELIEDGKKYKELLY